MHDSPNYTHAMPPIYWDKYKFDWTDLSSNIDFEAGVDSISSFGLSSGSWCIHQRIGVAQKHDGKVRPIAYASHTLQEYEKNYILSGPHTEWN